MIKLTILSSLFFLLTVFPICVIGKEVETSISADQITVQTDNILIATGNVTIQRGDVSIRAEVMTVNEEKNQIKLDGIIEFFDGNSLKLAAENAVLSDDLSAGIINAAQVLLDDTIRLRAEKVELSNGTVERAESIDRITSCEECESGVPLWYFTASSATNDVQNQNIIYRNVTLRLSGIPIGFIPYLRLPNPTVDRARGFLIPGLKITSNLGAGAMLPYFIPIGESRDLLLTPYISSKTKTMEYRYRQKFTNGDILINGAFSRDDISDGGLRNYYKASGNFKLAYGTNLKIEANRASDDTYLRDYSYDSEDDLTTDISLGKVVVNNVRLFSADLNYIRDKKDDNSIEEFYALNGEYRKRIVETLFPGNLFFKVEGNSLLNIAQGGQVSRPPSSVASEIEYSNARYAGPVQILDQSFARVTSFVNSENTESLQEEFAFQYGASSILSIPFYQAKNTSVHQLSPKFMLSYNGQESSIKGDAFFGEDQLSFGNIYTGKKITSLSDSELGFSISGGLDYRINANDGRSLDLWLGGAWLQDTTYIINQNSRLKPKTTYYLGGFRYQSDTSFLVAGDTLISNEGDTLNTDLFSKAQIKDLNLSSRYEFIKANTGEGVDEDLEIINLSASYTGFKHFGVDATRRYDLTENAMANSKSSLNMNFSTGFWNYQFSQTFDAGKPEKTEVSAIYEDNCTRVRISLQNASQSIVSSESIQTLAFLVQLKPFASFTVPGI